MKLSLLIRSGVLLLLVGHGRSHFSGFYNSTYLKDRMQTILDSSPSSELPTSFRDAYGNPTNNRSQVRSVTYDVCMANTQDNAGFKVIDWMPFFNALFTFLIPSITLAPQLPMETGRPATNIFAMLLAIGNPMIAAYSLAMASLTCRRINRMCERLRRKFESLPDSLAGKKENYLIIVAALRIVMMETLHSPIYIDDEALVSFIMDEEYTEWWHELADEVFKKRRPVRLSLIVALMLVLLSQIFAIVVFFKGLDEDYPRVGLGLAVLSLWSWIPAIVSGAAGLGCLRSAKSIHEALRDVPIFKKKLGGASEERVTGGSLFKIRNERFLSPSDRVWGISTAGWVNTPGAMFTFARSENHLTLALTLGDELEHKFDNLVKYPGRQDVFLDEEPQEDPSRGNPAEERTIYLEETLLPVAEKVEERQPPEVSHELDPRSISDYDKVMRLEENITDSPDSIRRSSVPVSYFGSTHHSRLGHYIDCTIAVLISILLQWGTSGAAIFIAYNTPVVGVGCHSISYIANGGMATLSSICLGISSNLSRLSAEKNALRIPAIVMRQIGSALAMLNVVFILGFSILKFTNMLTNCYCGGSVIQRGFKTYVPVLMTGTQIKELAGKFWKGGTALALTSSLFTLIFFIVAKGDWLYGGPNIFNHIDDSNYHALESDPTENMSFDCRKENNIETTEIELKAVLTQPKIP